MHQWLESNDTFLSQHLKCFSQRVCVSVYIFCDIRVQTAKNTAEKRLKIKIFHLCGHAVGLEFASFFESFTMRKRIFVITLTTLSSFAHAQFNTHISTNVIDVIFLLYVLCRSTRGKCIFRFRLLVECLCRCYGKSESILAHQDLSSGNLSWTLCAWRSVTHVCVDRCEPERMQNNLIAALLRLESEFIRSISLFV